MNKVVIVGAGGFGREVLEIFKANNKETKIWDIVGFIDENMQLHGKIINGYPILGGMDWLTARKNGELQCVVAIGSPEMRKQVAQRVNNIGIHFCNAIHPSVILSEFIEFGEDIIICAGSILTVNIKIRNHVHININSIIGHDTIIGSYTTINPTVAVGGNVKLGEGVTLGVGSAVIQQISIGNWSTIGAGAVVIKDIPKNSVAVGVPAKVIKTNIIRINNGK